MEGGGAGAGAGGRAGAGVERRDPESLDASSRSQPSKVLEADAAVPSFDSVLERSLEFECAG